MAKNTPSILSAEALVLLNDERGATAVEYALLLAMIAAVVAGVVTSLGGKVRDAFVPVDNTLP